MKIITISVTNDLITDQRTHKIASTLTKYGYQVFVIGRKIKNTPCLKRSYSVLRFKLLFNKNFLFYAEYNIRLFFYLLFKKLDILIANDLDTLLANYLVSKIKNKTLIYDSHELFTEVPELKNRKFVKNIWLKIEKSILPHIKYSYTVCQSVASVYKQRYNIDMHIIRNLPFCKQNFQNNNYKENILIKYKQQGKKIILYQGVLNIDRGLEYAILATQYLDNIILVLIGEGDISTKLKQIVKDKNLQDKVLFLGKIPFQELYNYTKIADIGISLEQNTCLNYYYSLPNKLFDYISCCVPVLASNLPEMHKIIKKYNIGITIHNFDPVYLAEKFKYMLESKEYDVWKNNLKKLAQEFCWEKEEEKLIKIFEGIT